MDMTGLALSAVAMRQAQTRSAISAEIVKQAHAQEAAFVQMIADQAQAAQALAASPPPGAGSVVDVTV